MNDPPALLNTTRGHDVVAYLAMGSTSSAGENRDEAIGYSFDVNVKGVWRACDPPSRGSPLRLRQAEGRDCALSADDTAHAFHTAFLVGKGASQRVGLAKAKDLVGWEPEL